MATTQYKKPSHQNQKSSHQENQIKIKVQTMKQTEIGWIPENWKVEKLGEIADIVGGGTPSTSIARYWNGDIDWFTPTEVGHSKYLFASRRKITYLGFKNASVNLLPKNSILLTTRAGIGDLGILKIEACTNQGFQSIICKENSFYQFVFYLMSTQKEQLMKNASGSTFLEISPSKIRNLQIPLPPLPEQEAIATALSDCDAWIDSLEAVLAKKRLIKQGAMQELLKPKEGWEVKKFEQIFLRVPSKKYQINSNEYFQEGRYPIVDQGKQKIVGYSDREDKVFFSGNIIVFGDHTRLIKYVNHPFIVGADGVQLLSSFNENIQFLYYLLSDFEIPNTGYNRHFKYLKDFDYHIPSLNEQTRIATILSDMDAEIEALEGKLEKARQIKQGMMQELLTGRVRLV